MIRRRLCSGEEAVNFSCVCERCYYYYSIQVFEKVMSVSLLRSRSTDGTTEIGEDYYLSEATPAKLKTHSSLLAPDRKSVV